MQNQFIAYMDGSRHFKSNSSGWGFIVYKNGKVFHQAFGEVPVIFEFQYEQFAFAQLMKFIMSSGIETIQIYTDALNLKNSIDKVGDYKPEVLKYEPELQLKNINVKIDWISTKNNGVADKLSRKYLEKYFFEEKHAFKENFKKGIVNGNVKHPKINYFHDTRMLHSVSTNGRIKERNFLNAVKYESVVIEVGEFKNSQKEVVKIVRAIKANGNKFDILEVQQATDNYIMQVLELSEKWLDFNKRILLCLTLEDSVFEELACFKKSTQSKQFHERFEALLENVVEFVLHDKLLLKENSVRLLKIKKKHIPDIDAKIYNIKERIKDKNDTALLGKLFGMELGKFKKSYKRNPDNTEKEKIIAEIRNNFSMDFSPNC